MTQLWIHALGAKAGGGITYFQAVLPELFRQLEGTGTRVVLLVPTLPQGIDIPTWCEVRVLRRTANNWLLHLLFDQFALPLRLAGAPGAVLFCSGSFAPLVKTAPTVVLIRNAIYFDPEFLRREHWTRRRWLKVQGALIRLTARGCRALHYPSRYMRLLAEQSATELSKIGMVNYYGIKEGISAARNGGSQAHPAGAPLRFLYVMNYTLQKNLGYLLQALALARDRGTKVQVLVTSWLDKGPIATASEDRELIARHALIESAFLLPIGPKHGKELTQLYGAVDGCVFPSICESFGHPMVEALAAGRPIICADRMYAREICGDLALYVDPARPEDLVRIWERWPEVIAGHAAADLETLTNRFSWPAHVSLLLDTLLDRAVA